MTVVLQPSAGDKFGDQIDIANMLLEGFDYGVEEVELNFNGEKRYMRTPHDDEQIRKFIWKDYNEEEK